MGLEITFRTTHEAAPGSGKLHGVSSFTSAMQDVPAKMLVADKYGNLVPCNYQYWSCSYDHGVGSGNFYIPSGERAVVPEDLSVIKTEFFESKSERSEGGDFHGFIRNLMDNSPTGVQFIRYDGVEEVDLPQEHWSFLGIKIPKKQRTLFAHRFSLCRLQPPIDKEYDEGIAKKKRQVIERNVNLGRLEQELSPLSVGECLQLSGQESSSFDIVPIEHSEEKMIPSGGSLPPIDELVSLARKNFVKKTPSRAQRVVAVQKDIVEIPSTFWVRGKQRITYRGVALVPKQEKS